MKIAGIQVAVAALSLSGPAQESFELVSATPGGSMGNDFSIYPRVSGDGRFVVFVSSASDLVPGDTNGAFDVFVRDLETRTTERVSLTSAGSQIGGFSGNGSGTSWVFDTPQISRDGSLVAFSSAAAGIVVGDTNGLHDAFLRDRVAGTTIRLSVDSSGAQLDGASGAVQMSADGRRFLFAHRPNGAAAGDIDWYVHDRASGTTNLASVSPADEAFRNTLSARLAAGGRHVLLQAVDQASPGRLGTFVRDLGAGVTTPVLPGSGWRGTAQADAIEIEPLEISANGRFVLCSASEDLDPLDGIDSEQWNAWVIDRTTATARLVTRLVSAPGGHWGPALGLTFGGLSHVSDDGRVARFSASSHGLLGSGYDGFDRIYYEVDTATTETRVLSLDWRIRPLSVYSAYDHVFSASDDGRAVVMITTGITGDGFPFSGNFHGDQIFVRRVTSPAGVNTCAGDGSGAACPCGTPGLPGRGCANAWTPRGSVLSTRGNASISDDTLTLISYDAPVALTVLLQSSTAAPAGGVPFSGGVACVGSPTLRIALDQPSDDLGVVDLFGRGASNGPRLHVVGAVTAPGTRYYQAWTRAIGGPGCLASRSSFSNGVRVEWRP